MAELQNKQVRTRIAPSPTGYLHIGTIYQILFDYAYAKRFCGKFLVRIEDTDRSRFVADAEEVIFRSMDWFGLKEDESVRYPGEFGPYRQSERLVLYKLYVEELLRKGHAYYCFCSKERLEEIRKQQQEEKRPIIMYDKHCRAMISEEVDLKLKEGAERVVRLKVPEHETITAHDQIRGDILFDSNLVDDQVLMKADGFPTYHLAVVVDDHLMKITHMVRGEEWLSSFPKQILLYRFFGWEPPLFYHTATLRNPDKLKLSKRHGHASVLWYQQEGYLPQAILNYIASLGWGHPQGKEIFSLEEFVNLFDLEDITPVGPIFDLTKLNWMNGEYIRMMSNVELEETLISFFTFRGDSEVLSYLHDNKKIMADLMILVKTRMKTLLDFKNLSLPLQKKYPLTEEEKKIGIALKHTFFSIEDWKSETILEGMRTVMKSFGIRGNVLYKVLTGSESGLPLPDTLKLLGKEEVLRRFEGLLG